MFYEVPIKIHTHPEHEVKEDRPTRRTMRVRKPTPPSLGI